MLREGCVVLRDIVQFKIKNYESFTIRNFFIYTKYKSIIRVTNNFELYDADIKFFLFRISKIFA